MESERRRDARALVEEHLPAAVAAHPERGAQRGRAGFGTVGANGTIEDESGIRGEELRAKIGEEKMGRRLALQQAEDLLLVEDASGAAEFEEVVGEESGDRGAVAADLRLEQAFFELA